ncbi:MAG: DUF4174 domain-containing protein [Rhodothermales bacterium]
MPEHPISRVDRFKYPAILIFAPSEKSPAFENQISLLRKEKMVDEGMIHVVQVLHEGACYADEEKLNEAEANGLRARYEVDEDEFTVVLVGKDGREVYRGDAPVQPDFLLETLQ